MSCISLHSGYKYSANSHERGMSSMHIISSKIETYSAKSDCDSFILEF